MQTDQNEKFVWIADASDRAVRRKITLGPLSEGLRVVRSGLTADDRVISAGVVPEDYAAGLVEVAAGLSGREVHWLGGVTTGSKTCCGGSMFEPSCDSFMVRPALRAS